MNPVGIGMAIRLNVMNVMENRKRKNANRLAEAVCSQRNRSRRRTIEHTTTVRSARIQENTLKIFVVVTALRLIVMNATCNEHNRCNRNVIC